MITKEELETYLEMSDKIESRADYILMWYNKNIEPANYRADFESIDDININYEEYYCGDTVHISLPTKFLTMNEEELTQYAKEYNEEKEARLAIEAKKLTKKKAARKELMESKQYTKFLELKEKFEGVDE